LKSLVIGVGAGWEDHERWSAVCKDVQTRQHPAIAKAVAGKVADLRRTL